MTSPEDRSLGVYATRLLGHFLTLMLLSSGVAVWWWMSPGGQESVQPVAARPAEQPASPIGQTPSPATVLAEEKAPKAKDTVQIVLSRSAPDLKHHVKNVPALKGRNLKINRQPGEYTRYSVFVCLDDGQSDFISDLRGSGRSLLVLHTPAVDVEKAKDYARQAAGGCVVKELASGDDGKTIADEIGKWLAGNPAAQR